MNAPQCPWHGLLIIAAMLLCPVAAQADVVTDWNAKLGELINESKLPTPPANRVMALVHTAMFEAANGVTELLTKPLGGNQIVYPIFYDIEN